MKLKGEVYATVHGEQVLCYVCTGGVFNYRETKLTTSGMALLDLEWANKSGVGLICVGCGYLLEFVPGIVKVLKVSP